MGFGKLIHLEIMMKKHPTLAWFCKFVGASILAFIMLNEFCVIYYNYPVHTPTDTGATDYVWDKNFRYSVATEGFGSGTMDSMGYNNSFPHDMNKGIDILIMGSSHMEAYQIAQNDNTTYVLNDLLHSNGSDDFAYNIGISGHDFLRCSSNFENAIKTFSPTKYVVIETNSVSFDQDAVDKALAGTYPKIPSHDNGIIGMLQRLPYLRLSFQQLQSFMGRSGEGAADTALTDQGHASVITQQYQDSFLQLLQKLSNTAKAHSVKLIILYHPQTAFNKDGSMRIETSTNYLALFKASCQTNGIIFADMSEHFLATYQNQHIVPYGFSNTAVDLGHLNKNGHRMAAELLYSLLPKSAAEVTK